MYKGSLLSRHCSIQTLYFDFRVSEPDFFFSLFGLEIFPLLLLFPLEGTVVILSGVELVEPHGPRVGAGAKEPDLALGVVGEEVGGGAGGDLGVLRGQVSLLVLVLQLGVLPQSVGMILRAPAAARDVDVVAAALEHRPVLLLVAMDEN